jgi:putative acetyltransferase
MDTLTHSIAAEDPRGADLALLMERHEADCSAESPPESCHRLNPADLARPAIRFFVGRIDGQPVSMGAVMDLGGGAGELKSMHVLAEWRGRGLSRQMLDLLLAEARAMGLRRVSLETGVQPIFRSARALYTRAGFTECPPFGNYRPDLASCFMTFDLTKPSAR